MRMRTGFGGAADLERKPKSGSDQYWPLAASGLSYLPRIRQDPNPVVLGSRSEVPKNMGWLDDHRPWLPEVNGDSSRLCDP